jgi:hypothetical protein
MLCLDFGKKTASSKSVNALGVAVRSLKKRGMVFEISKGHLKINCLNPGLRIQDTHFTSY